MKMSETRALYNKRALARLTRATPEIFPAPVLIHAPACAGRRRCRARG